MLILTVILTVAVCGLLVLAFALGVRHERRRREALDAWLGDLQRESFERAEALLFPDAAASGRPPTADEVEREFLAQSEAANVMPA